MKKRIFAIAAALILMVAPAMGQIFITEEEAWENTREGISSFDMDLPTYYDSNMDWYVPLGDGVVALACLSGAYLLGKRTRKE